MKNLENYQVMNPFGEVNHLHKLKGKGRAGIAHVRGFVESQFFGRL